jgi:NADPH-dependent glutamate synthase beta subunit-like oxidoreductase
VFTYLYGGAIMSQVTLTINGRTVKAEPNQTIVQAAQAADIYIPTLCYHPDLPPGGQVVPVQAVFQGPLRHTHTGDREGRGCGICLVEIQGQADLKPACATPVAQDLIVTTESDRIRAERQKKLSAVLANHPHACLTCAQNQGCTRTQCSSSVAENERCCPQLGHCELQAVADYVGIAGFTPRWIPTDLPILDGPLFTRNYNLCIGCTRCIRACRDLRGIEAIGFVRDAQGRNIVGSLAASLEESGCKFCTACVEVCPTGALTDKKVRPGSREKDLVPCRSACPAGIDIPWYLRLIAEGRFDEAHTVIREKVPLPGVLGRICIRPCEDACRRGDVNQPLAICALKRAAADRQSDSWRQAAVIAPDTGRKAAVVGAGPSGLACAFFLRQAGHRVTVFESEPEPGGMLRYGIPEYRLPRDVLTAEINSILDTGIQLVTGRTYGRDFTLAGLKAEGFQAIYLALGARKARRIPVDGSDLNGVMWGMDFLRAVRQGSPPHLSGRVVVVGGGNVAIDVALTAVRIGAAEVHLACLESRTEMPAHEWECQGALSAGVTFHNSWGPKAITGHERVTGLELVRCTSVLDQQGRFNPEFNDSEITTLAADYVILAVGQATDLDVLAAEPELKHQRGLILVTGDQAASIPGLWAGGDAAAMPGSVIAAIAAGRRAAAAMDLALGGSGRVEQTLFPRPPLDQYLGREEGFAQRTRATVPCRLPQARSPFEEIETGFDQDQARAEAARCLQCDLRLTMGQVARPPEKWHAFNPGTVNEVPEAEGVYQLADQDRNIISIKGALNLRQALQEALENNRNAAFFEWEEDKMFTKRESELLQQYLQKHGQLPGGGDDELDDLF